ncbi:MAG: family 78 glycoside hydrolase catalytic domain, partial [Planctomycetota bacterium]
MIRPMVAAAILETMLLTAAVNSAEPIERQARLTPSELTCEYAVNPLGVDAARPRFGWVLQSPQRDQMQSAYQVLVAGNEEKLLAGVGDKWDSGKVDSDRSVNVAYRGKALASGEKCYWKVRVWDKHGRPRAPTRGVGRWSKPGSFEMGLLKQSDWKGRWIGIGPGSLTYVAGRLGKAVQLDGEGETIKIPHSAKLKPAAQITISAWIKPTECTDAWREIYRKEDANARHLLAIGKTDGLWGLWCGLGVGGKYVERGAPLAKKLLTAGQWHLVAATYDGTSIRFFADGRQVGSAPVSGPLDTAGSSPAYIGSSSASTEFFPGGIDDVRIYDRALSPEQIRELAKGGDPSRWGVCADAIPAHPSGPDHLVGWWKLDGNLTNSAGGKDAVAVAVGASPSASPLLRNEFTVTKDVRRARVYISGIGFSELYLNGRKVSDRVLDPAATDYDKRVLYVTHDVTGRLRKGRNALGVMLGNGWYCEPGRLRYGDSPRVLLQMQIEHVDGSTASVTSDPTWKTIDGPVRRNDFWNGEVYDARLERPGWAKPGYDDSTWAAAAVKQPPGGFMQSQLMPAIKVNQTLRPVKLTNPKPGVYVYDLGQLFGGWARLRMRGPAGTSVAIRYSAHVSPESGLIDQGRYRGGGATDHYTLRGDGLEIYEPRFTYHPVRYVQIEGYPGEMTIDDLQGRVTYSDVDLSSRFECSNPVVNRIHQNVRWTLTNGLFGMPLDCLYREHWAWTDPATITGSLYPRKHMPLFWTKWLEDIAHAQRPDGNVPTICPSYPSSPHFDPAWGGNYPALVWYLYQYLDDERMLRRHYTGMRRCVDYHTSIAEDHIITRGRYGDHLLPGRSPGEEQFISQETPPPLVWTGYYYRGALVVSRAARLLGKTEDAKHYAELAERIKRAFNRKWLNRETCQYATGSQTANRLPRALRIAPRDQRSGVLENVVDSIAREYDGHLHTGNTGTTCMIDTL